MFYPIALKILRDNCTGAKKLANGTFYYFVKGIRIGDDGNIYASPRIEDSIFNADNEEDLSLSFSAIVGANGSGKSTLVELLIRMCNNLGASVLGEYSALQNSPHLHFINGIYAELYYRVDKGKQMNFFCLRIEGRKVVLSRCPFIYEGNKNDGSLIYDNGGSTEPNLDTAVPFDIHTSFPHELALEDILEDFFYTYVSNYSTYAYNPADFSNEETPISYERKCRRLGSVIPKQEQCHWLEGVFHRNMLYQEPLVLYPNRINGNIDINTENHLAYLRFIAVLINKDSRFKLINDHIEAKGLKVSVDPALKYDDKLIRKKAKYSFTINGYRGLREDIISIWSRCVEVDLKAKGSERHYGSLALDYLVYKTLKISSAYPKFNPYFHKKYSKSKARYEYSQLERYILRLVNEPSHVTRKIRQTLVYLIFGLYDFDVDQMDFSLETLPDLCAEIIGNLKEMVRNNPKLRILMLNGMEDLTPPPFMHSEVMLRDSFSDESIGFGTLSSGERQIIYNVTGILFQLLNIDSISPGGIDRIVGYTNINIILEEIEQFFHPDMQRKLVKFLMDSIRQCSFRHLKAINIMLVTHSPFILSDIPARNVLALTKDGLPLDEKEVIKSFGANIHDILHHPFFLKDGAVGEFANEYIIKLGKAIANIGIKEAKNKDSDSGELESFINLIDEPILKQILWEELNRKTDSVESRRRLLQIQIEELQRQKDAL